MKLRELNHNKNALLRQLKARAVKWLLDKPNPNCFSPKDLPSIRKVLFLRNDNKLGDMIVSTFSFRELKKQLPSVEISVLAGPNSAQILLGNPNINHIVIYKKGLRHLFKLGKLLKQEHFDLYIDLDKQPTAQTLYLLYCIQPRFAFGFNRREYQLYNITCPFSFDSHITRWHTKVFESLGLQAPSGGYDLYVPAGSVCRAEAFFQGLPKRKNVVVNPFAASRHRCLCAEQITILARLLPACNIILVGEASRLENWRQSLKDVGAEHLFWQPENTSLFDVFALIQSGDLFLSPDTGLVHAASALGKKQVCIYKSSDSVNQKIWAPLGPASIINAPDEFADLDMTLVAGEVKKYI